MKKSELTFYSRPVNCPVSNHFYFKADSKYLLRGNKILSLLFT